MGVINRRVRQHDTGFRHRDNKAAATFAISRLLSQHLAREIPHEQQYIVGLIRQQLIGMADRYALPGHVLTLFIRIGIDNKLEEAFAEIEIVY